ncbi:MAG: hypothetical protein WCD44_04585 [Candidatus Babeliales bacterium]
MSISYSVTLTLDFAYKKNNIEYFFKKCLEDNIYLYQDSFDLTKLDGKYAADRILNMELEEEERCVRAIFQDTDFSIWLYNKNNLISFSIDDFGIKWRKNFMDDYYGFDFARYIRLLLRMCNEFTILSLETDAF